MTDRSGVASETSALPLLSVLSGGLAVGVLGDYLLRAQGAPGLNFVLLFMALALAMVLLRRRTKERLSREAAIALTAGLLIATGMVWRDSMALRLLSFFGAAAAFALTAYQAGRAWIRGSRLGDYVEALAGAGVYAALGSLLPIGDRRWWPDSGSSAGGSFLRRAEPVLRGIVLAMPLLILFGLLFMAADPIFRDIVGTLVQLDVEALVEHIVVTGVLTWLAAGFLVGFARGTGAPSLRAVLPRPKMGIVEIGTALGLVDLLFLAFVVIQLRYLFGGSGLVEVTPGLTHAEYVREGFAQLALASALVLPSLLAADSLLERQRPADARVFQAVGGLQLILLLFVIASAVERVRAYQAAYGLTEARFYGTVFLAWLVLLTLWFGWTVLRERRERFVYVPLLSLPLFLAGLHLANPDALVARANLGRLDRMGTAGAGTAQTLDATYLSTLSGDAVPLLLEELPDLSPGDGCRVASGLLDRWALQGRGDWRAWNWSNARARAMISARAEELRALAARGEDCS